MVKFFDKLGPNTIAAITAAAAIIGTLYSTERASIISQKCHNDILELEIAKHELNQSKFEFEKQKYLDLLTQPNNTSNTIEVSKIVKIESSNIIPSSNIDSFNKIPSSNENILIDNLNELLEQYGNNVLFLTSIVIIMISIITLTNFQGLLSNYLIKKYGDKYQDYIPKWLKKVWTINYKIINYTNRYYVIIIICSQLTLLLFGLYLLFRVVLYI